MSQYIRTTPIPARPPAKISSYTFWVRGGIAGSSKIDPPSISRLESNNDLATLSTLTVSDGVEYWDYRTGTNERHYFDEEEIFEFQHARGIDPQRLTTVEQGMTMNFTPEKETIKNKIAVSFDELQLLIDSPKDFYRDNKLDYSLKDRFAALMIGDPDQFDELYTVEVDRPESPLLRKYLDNLALLTNKEMREKDEINEFEKLQAAAYEQVGYVGKTLEVVKQEALDYPNYFRFLLSKEDKTVISPEDKVRFDRVVEETKDSSKILKKFRNIKVEGEIPGCQSFYFSDVAPYLTNKNGAIEVRYYTLIDKHLRDFELETNRLGLRIALYSSVIENDGLKKTGKKPEMFFTLVVIDKFSNHAYFPVKTGTITKYKKELMGILAGIDISIATGEKLTPWDFTKTIDKKI